MQKNVLNNLIRIIYRGYPKTLCNEIDSWKGLQWATSEATHAMITPRRNFFQILSHYFDPSESTFYPWFFCTKMELAIPNTTSTSIRKATMVHPHALDPIPRNPILSNGGDRNVESHCIGRCYWEGDSNSKSVASRPVCLFHGPDHNARCSWWPPRITSQWRHTEGKQPCQWGHQTQMPELSAVDFSKIQWAFDCGC